MTFKEKYQSVKAERQKFIAALNPKSFDFQIATWFGTGLIIPAPGTWGTLGGFIFGLILSFFTNGFFVFIASLLLFYIGLKSVERLEKTLNNHDPSFIVIDEVAAILLILAFNSLIINWLGSVNIKGEIPFILNIISFALFRFYDAKKPSYIGVVDRKVHGAWGVMLDDTLAALYTIATGSVLLLIFFLISFFFMH